MDIINTLISRFEVVTLMTIKLNLFRDMKPCGLHTCQTMCYGIPAYRKIKRMSFDKGKSTCAQNHLWKWVIIFLSYSCVPYKLTNIHTYKLLHVFLNKLYYPCWTFNWSLREFFFVNLLFDWINTEAIHNLLKQQ
jgi:hypothetical protein